jgi:ketosteroid isomerase-like protein
MDDIDNLIALYRDGFATLDASLLSSMWDDSEILYSAAELANPITGKPELDDYYRNLAELFSSAEAMHVFDICRKQPGTDVTVVYFRFRFRAHFATGALHAVEGRATIVFRRGKSGWRGVHYHESLAPESSAAQSL